MPDERKQQLLNDIRLSAHRIAKEKTRGDAQYRGMSPTERATSYLRKVLTARPSGEEDKELLAFVEGRTERLTGYGISVLMAAIGCTVNDIFPSIQPSKERVPRGAEAFQGIGSYWDAVNYVISS